MRQVKPVPTISWDADVAGFWRLFAYPAIVGMGGVDITSFRGAPTQLKRMSFQDPFGARDFSFTLPGATAFDRIGVGDLAWCHKFASVSLVYYGALPAGYGFGRGVFTPGATHWWEPTHSYVPMFSWDGFLASVDYTNTSLSLTAKGSLYQLDGYLAHPEFPPRPLPYEWAMSEKFLNHPLLRLRPLAISWPAWWTTRYVAPAKKTPAYLVPAHVMPGARWLGLVTRSTGNDDPVLSSYLMSMLAGMYTQRGRWTMDLLPGGQPVLLHRDMLTSPDGSTVVIDAADTESPQLSLREDWSQSIGAVFGKGVTLAGTHYSGMNVSADGAFTSYEPLAALRQVHPESSKNDWLDVSTMRQEVMLQLPDGLDELDAAAVARSHLYRFADPGVIGTAVLRHDPTVGGVSLPLHLVRAGMTMVAPGVLGRPEGVLAHISENEVDFEQGTNTLTIDTRYRDALTVAEVRIRGRDAMQIPRMLVAGQYTPPISDQLVPWDYGGGSGMIPSGKPYSALELFDGMPADSEFPWEDWTVAHPPSSARWRNCYIPIGKASRNADLNWANVGGANKGGRYGIPIRLSQSGQIRLLQLAAYDSSGHVLPVEFHFSLYYSSGVNVASMPKVPAGTFYRPFKTGQHYPFIRNGWEQYNADGTRPRTENQDAVASVLLIRGWGHYYERAGHSPGLSSARDPSTGLLIDETQWSFDTTGGGVNVFDPYSTRQPKLAGKVYAMIYCDAQSNQPVYFLGRMFRVEPGASG